MTQACGNLFQGRQNCVVTKGLSIYILHSHRRRGYDSPLSHTMSKLADRPRFETARLSFFAFCGLLGLAWVPLWLFTSRRIPPQYGSQELAVASGYGYSTVRQWHANGMPLIDGKITLREALAWRKQYEKAKRSESQSPIPTVLHHPLLAAGKSGVPA